MFVMWKQPCWPGFKHVKPELANQNLKFLIRTNLYSEVPFLTLFPSEIVKYSAGNIQILQNREKKKKDAAIFPETVEKCKGKKTGMNKRAWNSGTGDKENVRSMFCFSEYFDSGSLWGFVMSTHWIF